jgi:hypothetical protein
MSIEKLVYLRELLIHRDDEKAETLCRSLLVLRYELVQSQGTTAPLAHFAQSSAYGTYIHRCVAIQRESTKLSTRLQCVNRNELTQGQGWDENLLAPIAASPWPGGSK